MDWVFWLIVWGTVEIDEAAKAAILSQPFFKGKIVSGSMDPVIKVGEQVLVEIKAQNLKKFDIIVFVQDKKLICHYLWSMNRIVKPLLFQTRSLSGVRDFPIAEGDYIGKVLSHKLSPFRKLRILLFQ